MRIYIEYTLGRLELRCETGLDLYLSVEKESDVIGSGAGDIKLEKVLVVGFALLLRVYGF